MKIKAITPLGTFISVEQPFTDSERQRLNQMLSTNIDDLEYYNCVTEEGPVYFGPEVIRNSVFVILD